MQLSDSTFLVDTGFAVTENHLHETIPTLHPTWSVSLEWMPEDKPHNDWANLFHMTIGPNNEAPGNRIPGIFSSPNTHQLRVMSYVNGNHNYQVILSQIPKPNEWYQIWIEQKLVDAKYIYTISVNGNEVHSIENTTPDTFNNVEAYVSNPFIGAMPGFVRNLHISTEGKFYFCFFV